mmetsp:Transcript_71509/g.209598  ORF Transcript_71509/g.209598 Transcript_71509/m.209598 type:complete len:337 (-) Transcript_71509:435-1445(-)
MRAGRDMVRPMNSQVLANAALARSLEAPRLQFVVVEVPVFVKSFPSDVSLPSSAALGCAAGRRAGRQILEWLRRDPPARVEGGEPAPGAWGLRGRPSPPLQSPEPAEAHRPLRPCRSEAARGWAPVARRGHRFDAAEMRRAANALAYEVLAQRVRCVRRRAAAYCVQRAVRAWSSRRRARLQAVQLTAFCCRNLYASAARRRIAAPVFGPPMPTDEQWLEIAAEKADMERKTMIDSLEPLLPAVSRVLRRLRTVCVKCGACMAPEVGYDKTCSFCETSLPCSIVVRCRSKKCKGGQGCRCLNVATCARGLFDVALKQETSFAEYEAFCQAHGGAAT